MFLRDFVDFVGFEAGEDGYEDDGVLNSGRRTQPQVGEVGELAPDMTGVDNEDPLFSDNDKSLVTHRAGTPENSDTRPSV